MIRGAGGHRQILVACADLQQVPDESLIERGRLAGRWVLWVGTANRRDGSVAIKQLGCGEVEMRGIDGQPAFSGGARWERGGQGRIGSGACDGRWQVELGLANVVGRGLLVVTGDNELMHFATGGSDSGSGVGCVLNLELKQKERPLLFLPNQRDGQPFFGRLRRANARGVSGNSYLCYRLGVRGRK